MKIILIGFMGAGKSTVAQHVAKKLALEHIEMDEVVLKESGQESIAQIFAVKGEPAFRELEISVAKKLRDNAKAVIATGGGVVMNKLNIDYLKGKDGQVIYLHADFKTIEDRLTGDNTRPLMHDKTKAKELYDLRQTLYNAYADTTVKTDGKTIEEIVSDVIASVT